MRKPKAIFTVLIDAGHAQFVYDDQLAELLAEGDATVRRVSHVEPSPAGGWTADMSPVGGPVLGPFFRRAFALNAEREWLTATQGL